MRLLEISSVGQLIISEDLVDNGEVPLPPCAILSHTWVEGEEVSFSDLIHNTGGHKSGYKKIQFCAKRASSDGLRHF